MPRRIARTALVTALLLAAANGQASEIFEVHVDPGVIEFDRTGLRVADYGTRLTVAGPEGFTLMRHFEPGQRIEVLRSDLPLEGAYSYELQILGPSGTRSGHALPSIEPQFGLPSQGGGFAIEAAQFVPPNLVEAPKRSVQDTPPARGSTRNTFTGDQSFIGNLCVGLDCVTGEGFSDEVIKVKENNTRIRFQDTSNSSSFPTTDWELTANESSNGGRSQFAITDLDAGTTPFSVSAGAPDGALSVGNGGRLGVGTQTPLTDLHLRTGNTPTLRLDQDGSGGFSGQTWDLGANESEFFLRDTSAFRVPFRVRPGAPTDSLTIDSNGQVGLGTQSPAAQLHLQQAGVGPGIRLVNTGSTPRSWDAGLVDAAGEFVIDDASTPSTEFELTAGGNLTISGTLTSARSPRLEKGTSVADLQVTAAALDANGTLPGFESGAGHDVIAFQQAMLVQIKALTERTLEQERRIEALQSELQSLRAERIRD